MNLIGSGALQCVESESLTRSLHLIQLPVYLCLKFYSGYNGVLTLPRLLENKIGRKRISFTFSWKTPSAREDKSCWRPLQSWPRYWSQRSTQGAGAGAGVLWPRSSLTGWTDGPLPLKTDRRSCRTSWLWELESWRDWEINGATGRDWGGVRRGSLSWRSR